MQQEKLIEAYTRLRALKANLPDSYSIEEKYVQEFHKILSILEQESGTSLSGFRIPLEELKPRVTSSNYLTHETFYTDWPECDRSYLMMRIDGVLGFFEIQMSAQKTAIGFSAR